MTEIRASISLRDNFSAVLRSIKNEQSSFRKDVESTKRAMDKAYKERRELRINNSVAMKAINAVKNKLAPLRNKVVTAVAIKERVTEKLRTVKNKLKSVGKMVVSPVVKIKNAIGAGIGKIKTILGGLTKTVMIPVAIAATAGVAGTTKILGAGFELEKQKLSMEHFIGATNKDLGIEEVKQVAENFTEELRKNANATPFETGEVIQAGSRAIAIANGNTAEAMSLVKLAEDMAAASGGTKSISDAMEALADAKLGEMERLKEFGFKVSAEEFKQKGFEGVSEDLNGFFGGASEKLAKSGSGLLSTIVGKLKSNFADMGLSLVEKLKPFFEGAIDLIDATAPHFEKFSGMMVDGIATGIKAVIGFIPVLKQAFATFKPIAMNLYNAIMPVVQSIMDGLSVMIPAVLPIVESVLTTVTDVISSATPIVTTMVDVISNAVATLAPIFKTIFDEIGEKVGTVLDFVGSQMGWIKDVIENAMPIISSVIETAWSVISPVMDIMISVFQGLWEVVKFVFPAIQGVVETVWSVIQPIIDALAAALGWLADAMKTVGDAVGWVGDKVSAVGGWIGDTAVGVGNFVGGAVSGIGDFFGGLFGGNARGTDSWKGGVTWVGEEGPELIEVPKGARILPSKTSAAIANSTGTLGAPKVSNTLIEKESNVSFSIAKIADSIIIREDADIEKIGEAIFRRVSMAKLVRA